MCCNLKAFLHLCEHRLEDVSHVICLYSGVSMEQKRRNRGSLLQLSKPWLWRDGLPLRHRIATFNWCLGALYWPKAEVCQDLEGAEQVIGERWEQLAGSCQKWSRGSAADSWHQTQAPSRLTHCVWHFPDTQVLSFCAGIEKKNF